MSEWTRFDEGRSLGTEGSEGGIILVDEELAGAARITIEAGGHTAPFSITCGVYGCMVHTRFFSSEPEARVQCSEMQRALAELVSLLDEEIDDDTVGDWCARFVRLFP